MAEHGNYNNEFGWFADKPTVKARFYNAKAVIVGLTIFLVLVTLPLWKNLGKVIPAPDPKLDTPAIMAMKEKKCVESREFMKANHMLLLVDWREEVVRTGNREYTATDGKKYNASLSNTCMECHSNYSQFCNSCHGYVGVVPNCWGCHLDREKKQLAKAEGK